MFRGELCTSVFRPGQKVSVSLEPFFSLPLDVQSERAWTVDDALLQLTEKERLLDDKTNVSPAFQIASCLKLLRRFAETVHHRAL